MDPSTMTTMSPQERLYFEEVGTQCWEDAQFCESGLPTIMASFLSLPPPPEPMLMMQDIASVVELMMRSMAEEMPGPQISLQTQQQISPDVQQPVEPVEQNNEQPVEVPPEQNKERALDSEEANEEESSFPLIIFHGSFSSPCEEMFVRHLISQFIPMVSDESESLVLAEKINSHGNAMLGLQPEEGTHVFRVARRLSEVTPEEVMQHRRDHFLPFSADKSECLVSAYQERRVSFPCGNALKTLEHVRAMQFQMKIDQHNQELDAYANLTTMYFLIFATAIVLFCRRQTMQNMANRDPMAVHRMRKTRLLTVIGFSGMSILCLLGYISTSNLLQGGVLFSAYIFLRAVFSSWENDETSCCCCCCGASPEDAKAGNLTEVQMCCSCCCGTGACVDCGNGCCEDQRSPADYQLMTDLKCCDCACCADGCCGGSCCEGCSKNKCCEAKSGVNCCDCACCADGCCGGGCCACCSGDSTPDGKRVFKPRHEIYEGVPIQVV